MATVGFSLLWATTSTSGSGSFFDVSGSVTSGGTTYRPFSALTNGTEIPIIRCDASGAYEEGRVTVSQQGGGVTRLTWVTRTATSNSNAPVSWSVGGTQNVRCEYVPGVAMMASNNLSDLASTSAARTSMGLGTAAVQPAERTGFVPLASPWTGGTNGKVVRVASANTLADAANTDTVAQLVGLMFKGPAGEGYYASGRVVSGLSGLTAGTVYYLATAGSLTSTAPTPSGSVRWVVIGRALSTTELLFQPSLPVGG